MEADEVKAAVDGLMTGWEEFKATNDARLAEIEKKGSADVLLGEKVDRIEKTLAGLEGVNQKLTRAELEAKRSKDKLDEIEVKLGRLPGARGNGADAKDEMKARVNAWVRAVVSAHTVGVVNLGEVERKALADTAAEYKALAITPDTSGGYLAPVEYVREILKGVTEMTPFRSAARVRTTAAKSIQIPKRTGQFAAQWVAERGTRSETTGLTYGLEELTAHEMFALVDITSQMLEDSAFDLESEIRMEAEEQFALAEGTAFISGNGVGKPEGITVNSSVATVASGHATLLTADGLLSLFYGIKTAYARNGVWMLNRSTVSSVRKLKDGQGQYLWQPGISQGVPNTIHGAPYVEAPDMANVGAAAKPVAFGDFMRGYLIVDRLAVEALRDPFTQATSGAIRFVFRRRVGGQVVMPEAFALQTVSAS